VAGWLVRPCICDAACITFPVKAIKTRQTLAGIPELLQAHRQWPIGAPSQDRLVQALEMEVCRLGPGLGYGTRLSC